jgi:hypothetical protein
MNMMMNKKHKAILNIALLLMTCGLSLADMRSAAAYTDTQQDYEALQARQDAKNMLTIIDDINKGRLDRICLLAEVSLKMDQTILDPLSNLRVSTDIDKAKNAEAFKAIQEYFKSGACKPHQ